MSIRRWPSWFRDLYGGEWPGSYMTVDTETTGFSKDRDVIVEIGHCLVEGGVVVSELNVVLDWSSHRIVGQNFIRHKLREVADQMGKQGRHYGMTFERMCNEGIEPEKALRCYSKLLRNWAESGGLFALHDGFFDEGMLASNFVGFGIDKNGFSFPENQYFDTASIERCLQVDNAACAPFGGETMKKYFYRTKNLGGNKIHTSLDRHCVEKYGWRSRPEFVQDKCHGAGFDSYLVHLLMEEYRVHADAPPSNDQVRVSMPELFKHDRPEPRESPPEVFGQGLRRRRGQRNR